MKWFDRWMDRVCFVELAAGMYLFGIFTALLAFLLIAPGVFYIE